MSLAVENGWMTRGLIIEEDARKSMLEYFKKSGPDG
jgi:hypothetical protein